MISPQFALRHDRLHGIFHALGRVLMPFEQAFYQSTHTGACAFLSLPVDRPVFAQQIGQFLSNCDHDVMYRGWITPKNITS